jgi:hypothetical protein
MAVGKRAFRRSMIKTSRQIPRLTTNFNFPIVNHTKYPDASYADASYATLQKDFPIYLEEPLETLVGNSLLFAS